MKIDVVLDGSTLRDAIIIPDAKDDIAKLNSISKELHICNPVYDFRENAINGMYNHLSEDEYRALLRRYKALGSLFIDESSPDRKQLPGENLFLLCERLLNAFLLCMDTYGAQMMIQ